MLYVDEPIGTGFSYGTDTVVGTVSAAPFVWKLLQAFFAQFPEYECRDFGLFTESYGGHYGPGMSPFHWIPNGLLTRSEFAYYFESQNAAIAKGQVKDATHIDLIALGVNNGWYDATIQEREFIDFSRNNSYYPLINDTIYTEYMQGYETTCLPALEKCTSTTGEVSECYNAEVACGNNDNAFAIYYPNIDYYDIRQSNLSLYPPETYVNYLSDPAVMKAIGAKSTYIECSDPVDLPFFHYGDGKSAILESLKLTDTVKVPGPSSQLSPPSYSLELLSSSGLVMLMPCVTGLAGLRQQMQFNMLDPRLSERSPLLITLSVVSPKERSRTWII